MNLRTFFYTVFALIVVFLGLFIWSSYRYYETVHADDPIDPVLVATSGLSKVIRGDLTYELSESEEYNLLDKDIIETGIESKATITWPDKSITRLGPNTRIVIEKMYASLNYDSIKIAYNLERWKVWNTIIRTFVGDSYFEVILPKESIVAWVRGTTFEINLDNKYIHAVSHSTLLSQKGQKIEIFPWEIVDSENILIKRGKEWLDTTWNEWNSSADFIYDSLEKLEIDNRIKNLTKDIGKWNIGNISRNVLSNIAWFEDIKIAEYLDTNRIDKLTDISTDSLLSYYQKLGNFSHPETKETLRKSILSVENSTIAKFRDWLEVQAFWESLDNWILTETTKHYLEKKWVNINDFTTKFKDGVKNDLDTFENSLSGALKSIF